MPSSTPPRSGSTGVWTSSSTRVMSGCAEGVHPMQSIPPTLYPLTVHPSISATQWVFPSTSGSKQDTYMHGKQKVPKRPEKFPVNIFHNILFFRVFVLGIHSIVLVLKTRD